MPNIGHANFGVLRGGEHGSFTRLTVTTEDSIFMAKAIKVAERNYTIKISPMVELVDTSRLFDRLSDQRVETVTNSNEGLNIRLKCNCVLSARVEDRRLVVLDISSASTADARIFSEPTKDKSRLQSHHVNNIFSIPSDKIYSLNFSQIRALTKEFASKVNVNPEIHEFRNFDMFSFEEVTRSNLKGEDFEKSKIDENGINSCIWIDRLWNFIKIDDLDAGNTDALNSKSHDNYIISGIAELVRLDTLRYLSLGYIEEAQEVFRLAGPTGGEIGQLADLGGILIGKKKPKVDRFGQCSPLNDLLIAGWRKATDISNETKLDLIHSFSELSEGLQVLLYPRLDWLLKDGPLENLPNLEAYLSAEAALSERMKPTQGTRAVVVGNPDGLIAVSIELRGTEAEKDSWYAAFKSYLDHQRYFDALDSMSSGHPLSMEENDKALSELVEHLVTDASSVIFLQIALGQLPKLTQKLNAPDIDRVAWRLVNEGFSDAAKKAYPAAMPISGTSADDLKTDELALDGEGKVQKAQGMKTDAKFFAVPDEVTVVTAQQDLDGATAVREALVERFAR